MMALGLKKSLAPGAGLYLQRQGGLVLAVGALIQLVLGIVVMRVQPAGIVAELNSNMLWRVAGFAFLGTGLVTAAMGALAFLSPAGRGVLVVVAASLIGFLNIVFMTLVRDGLRDVTLLSHGYDVWAREVVPNWSVVGLFLVTFVVGLGVAGWLISVVARAQQEEESYA